MKNPQNRHNKTHNQRVISSNQRPLHKINIQFNLLLLAFTSTSLPFWRNYNLTFKRRNLHKLIQTTDTTELLTELLDLIGINEVCRPTAEVKRVVAGPNIDDVLFLRAAGGENVFSAAVDLCVLVELGVDVLLSAGPSGLIWG